MSVVTVWLGKITKNDRKKDYEAEWLDVEERVRVGVCHVPMYLVG